MQVHTASYNKIALKFYLCGVCKWINWLNSKYNFERQQNLLFCTLISYGSVCSRLIFLALKYNTEYTLIVIRINKEKKEIIVIVFKLELLVLVPYIDVKIMDKENIYRSRLVKQEDSCHYLFKITWVLPISKTSEGILTVFIATPIYLLNRWCIQTRSAFLFRAFNRTYYNSFVEIFSSMHFVLLFVSFVILTSDNITKRISANEYAIKANSKTHVIDFCNNAGCNFVKQVSITISYQITFFFFQHYDMSVIE